MKLDFDSSSSPTHVNQYNQHVNTNHGVLDLIRPRRAIYGKHHEPAPKVSSKPRPTVFDRMVMFEMAASSSDLDDLLEKLQVIIIFSLITCGSRPINNKTACMLFVSVTLTLLFIFRFLY